MRFSLGVGSCSLTLGQSSLLAIFGFPLGLCVCVCVRLCLYVTPPTHLFIVMSDAILPGCRFLFLDTRPELTLGDLWLSLGFVCVCVCVCVSLCVRLCLLVTHPTHLFIVMSDAILPGCRFLFLDTRPELTLGDPWLSLGFVCVCVCVCHCVSDCVS